ncbi:MAG: hypothetical protein QM770_22810 [Tepidisphaeraceae bacterium]
MTPFNDLYLDDMNSAAHLANAVRSANAARRAQQVVRSAADDFSASTDLTPHDARIEPGQLAARVSLGGLSLVRRPAKLAHSA